MSGGLNCYPGTDVLINNYNIRDKELLEKLEIQKVMVKLLGLDTKPERIGYTYDKAHLINIHMFLFGELYEWAGTFRKENLYKSERVLSGGSAEYADYKDIEIKLKNFFEKNNRVNWKNKIKLYDNVLNFLLELWCIHPFREGNTRTCITFLWHYLKGKEVDFKVALLRNNPMYVRDSLVMANYDQKEYLEKIIYDALNDATSMKNYKELDNNTVEEYKIAKKDYEAFRKKYAIRKD